MSLHAFPAFRSNSRASAVSLGQYIDSVSTEDGKRAKRVRDLHGNVLRCGFTVGSQPPSAAPRTCAPIPRPQHVIRIEYETDVDACLALSDAQRVHVREIVFANDIELPVHRCRALAEVRWKKRPSDFGNVLRTRRVLFRRLRSLHAWCSVACIPMPARLFR
jgi:hypothetical protein